LPKPGRSTRKANPKPVKAKSPKERQEVGAGGNLKQRDKMALCVPILIHIRNAFPDVPRLSGANVFAHDRFKLSKLIGRHGIFWRNRQPKCARQRRKSGLNGGKSPELAEMYGCFPALSSHRLAFSDFRCCDQVYLAVDFTTHTKQVSPLQIPSDFIGRYRNLVGRVMLCSTEGRIGDPIHTIPKPMRHKPLTIGCNSLK